jgi:tRNA A37 threonylcarbamoyladenosine modification protein TsaB
MFNTLNLKELRLLLRELREHHSIKNSSKMKKPELVAALSARFNLVSGNLYLREDVRPAKEPKIDAKELETRLKKHLRALTTDELNSTAKQIKNEFQAMTGVDMSPHKELFKKLSRAESEFRGTVEPPKKDLKTIPKDAGVKIGKNRYATTRPI